MSLMSCRVFTTQSNLSTRRDNVVPPSCNTEASETLPATCWGGQLVVFHFICPEGFGGSPLALQVIWELLDRQDLSHRRRASTVGSQAAKGPNGDLEASE